MKKNFNRRQILIRALSYKQLSFLIKEKVLSLYIENTLQSFVNDADKFEYFICHRIQNITFIQSSFVWRRTKEDHYFWQELDRKFY